MDVKLFNSLTNKVETLQPIKPGEVSIYCCGPTVYGDAHVGNARPPVVFDTLKRYLTELGYQVTLVSNFTDVDDKIINKAKEEGVSESVITERYIKAYKDVLSSLHVMPHDVNPRVTEYMPYIINYIADLIDLGAAYEVDGDVFFRISAIENYGELSNINMDDLRVGARIEENTKKESPLDFVLWKHTDVGIAWDSPWSKGRPGWHTECCVMINSIFKNGKIDIHGGGFDLKFPHHENEIAQAKAHNKNKIANIWMHNGFVNLGDTKMSKSLGNVILAKDAVKMYGADVFRILILSAHYRAPLQLTEENINSAKSQYVKIDTVVKQLALAIQTNGGSLSTNNIDISSFLEAMSIDFNTSNGFTELYSRIKDANSHLRTRPIEVSKLEEDYASIKRMLNVFGINTNERVLTDEELDLFKAYNQAKANKDFELSDKLRNELINRNIL